MAKFAAKFKGRCTNGHAIQVGDILDYTTDGIKCQLCESLFEIHEHEPVYSLKFCPVCCLELPLTGECGNC